MKAWNLILKRLPGHFTIHMQCRSYFSHLLPTSVTSTNQTHPKGSCDMLMVKKSNSGKWVVSKFEKEHNHSLGLLRKRRHLRKRKHFSSNTKNSKDHIELQQTDLESPTSRYNSLCREAIKYAEVGATSADAYNVVLHALREAAGKVVSVKNNVGADQKLSACSDIMDESIDIDSQVQPTLPLSQSFDTRTHAPNPQPQPRYEKPSQKLRMCNVCKPAGDHRSWGCPPRQAETFSHWKPVSL